MQKIVGFNGTYKDVSCGISLCVVLDDKGYYLYSLLREQQLKQHYSLEEIHRYEKEDRLTLFKKPQPFRKNTIVVYITNEMKQLVSTNFDSWKPLNANTVFKVLDKNYSVRLLNKWAAEILDIVLSKQEKNEDIEIIEPLIDMVLAASNDKKISRTAQLCYSQLLLDNNQEEVLKTQYLFFTDIGVSYEHLLELYKNKKLQIKIER